MVVEKFVLYAVQIEVVVFVCPFIRQTAFVLDPLNDIEGFHLGIHLGNVEITCDGDEFGNGQTNRLTPVDTKNTVQTHCDVVVGSRVYVHSHRCWNFEDGTNCRWNVSTRLGVCRDDSLASRLDTLGNGKPVWLLTGARAYVEPILCGVPARRTTVRVCSHSLFLWTFKCNTCRRKGIQSRLWNWLSDILERLDHLGSHGAKIHRSFIHHKSRLLNTAHESVGIHTWFTVRPWSNVKPSVWFTKAVPRACERVSFRELRHVLLPCDGSNKCLCTFNRDGDIGQTKLLKETHGLVDVLRVLDTGKKNRSILEKLIGQLRVFEFENHSRNRLDFWVITHRLKHSLGEFTKLFIQSGEIERFVDVKNTVNLAIHGFRTNQVFRTPPVLCDGEVCRLWISCSEDCDQTLCDYDRLWSPFRRDTRHAR